MLFALRRSTNLGGSQPLVFLDAKWSTDSRGSQPELFFGLRWSTGVSRMEIINRSAR